MDTVISTQLYKSRMRVEYVVLLAKEIGIVTNNKRGKKKDNLYYLRAFW